MGHYTTIARFARMAPSHQRQRRAAHAGGRLHADAGERSRPADDAPYRCPECGEGSVAQTECPRCEVAVYRCDAVFALPPPRGGAPRPRRGATERALAVFVTLLGVALAIVVVIAQVLRADPATSAYRIPSGPHEYVAYGVLFAIIVVASLGLFLAGSELGSRLGRLWSRRRSVKALRRRMRETPCADLDALPDRAEAPVRVRGRVRVEVRDGERQLMLDDGNARCRVRLSDALTAFDDDGPISILEDGATIDLVGVGERRLGAGESYRDARGEFELSAVTVFVER